MQNRTMTTAATTTPKPRRWLQFSLRTMVVVLICSIPCGWLARKMKQAKKQREAVQAIKDRMGTRVERVRFAWKCGTVRELKQLR